MQKERFIMKKLGEEVAYLRGLAEGLDIDDKSKEGKMIGKIVEILGCFADKVEELEYSVGDLEDQVEELEYEVEELQQEVEDLEEWLYDEDDDDYEDDDYDDEYDEDEDYDDDEDGLSFIEMECPNCSEVVEIDEELLFDDSVDVICPNCHAVILSSEDDCDDCDDSGGCGCGCEVESEDEEK